LQYLTTEQALADLASIHSIVSSAYSLTAANPWVSFGGSYAGALSAWLRQKYPTLFVGAVASSAPVQATYDFQGYMEVCRTYVRMLAYNCFVSGLRAWLLPLVQQSQLGQHVGYLELAVTIMLASCATLSCCVPYPGAHRIPGHIQRWQPVHVCGSIRGADGAGDDDKHLRPGPAGAAVHAVCRLAAQQRT
jgi:hypothetical protein